MDRKTEMKLDRCRAGENQPIDEDMSPEDKARKLAQYRVGAGQTHGEEYDTRGNNHAPEIYKDHAYESFTMEWSDRQTA